MAEDIGRVASPNRLSSSTGPASGSGPSGFDPAREALTFYRDEWAKAEHPFGFAGPDMVPTHRLLCDYGQRAAEALASTAPSAVTDAMIRAATESRARDDEGEFESLGDLIDFSGENKTRTVVRAALEAALSACDSGRLPKGEDAERLSAEQARAAPEEGHRPDPTGAQQ